MEFDLGLTYLGTHGVNLTDSLLENIKTWFSRHDVYDYISGLTEVSDEKIQEIVGLIPEVKSKIELITSQPTLNYDQITQEQILVIELRRLVGQLQELLRLYYRETRLGIVAKYYIETRYPIWLIANDLLKDDSQVLRILLCPVNNWPKGLTTIQTELVNQLIYLENIYTAQGRPIKFIQYSAESETSILSIYEVCQSIPVLILDPQVVDDDISFYSHFWNANWSNYRDLLITKFSWLEIEYDFIKLEVFKWLEVVESQEIDPEDKKIKLLQRHLKIMEAEQTAKNKGVRINRAYKPTNYHVKKAGKVIVKYLLFYAILMVDEYYLLHADTDQPLTPLGLTLLTEMLIDIPDFLYDNLIKQMVGFYQTLYPILKLRNSRVFLPDLILKVVDSLIKLSQNDLARKQLRLSLKYWLKVRNLENLNPKTLFDDVAFNLTPQDICYVEPVNNYLNILGEDQQFNIVTACYNRGMIRYYSQDYELAETDFDMVLELDHQHYLAIFYRALSRLSLEYYDDAIADLTLIINNDNCSWKKEALYYRGTAYSNLTEYNLALQDFEESLELGCLEAEPKLNYLINLLSQIEQRIIIPNPPQKKYRPSILAAIAEAEMQTKREKGLIYSYDVVLLNPDGTEKSRQTYEQEVAIREILPNGSYIDMIYIPGNDDINSFLIQKTPLTQLQWCAIMNNNPSFFQGDDLPVEKVSWNQVMEFITKLNEWVRLNERTYLDQFYIYQLPTETSWEYACRAGTNTDFHFGDVISPHLANYNGSCADPSGIKGIYRQQTTEVGSFKVANNFGLYDLHGLVWEWCQDKYGHNDSLRVLRGGSFYNFASNCTSSFRYGCNVTNRMDNIGFRLAISIVK